MPAFQPPPVLPLVAVGLPAALGGTSRPADVLERVLVKRDIGL